ncbi:MAG TPA: glycoside hydrolase family 43 protein [Kofleriaceae bacterium]|nr:glycoside hydrolase family 43 protein [Kofleriaceae bacterium]
MSRLAPVCLPLLVACSGDLTGGGDAGASSADDAARVVTDAAPPDARDPVSYQNPVLDQSCPDPGVLFDEERATYYMVCTQGTYPIWQSADLTAWAPSGAAIFPDGQRPTWSTDPYWAPEIHRVGGGYVAYFTARVAPDGRLAIGAARASHPLGPYEDIGQPLVHDTSVSMIDASYFRAPDGRQYLFWKSNGNALDPKQPTHIYGRELAQDGVSFVGPTEDLMENDLGWEADVVEAPWVREHDGDFFLFYSGNVYDARYRTGVARSTVSPLGPYEKRGDPILGNNDVWVGPGHGSVVVGPLGDDVFVYHGRPAADPDSGRRVLADRVDWGADGWPTIHDGTPSHGEVTWQ